MANLFSCIEYKKDGNSVKIVRRELLPVAGCSSVFSCVECVNYGSFTREFQRVRLLGAILKPAQLVRRGE